MNLWVPLRWSILLTPRIVNVQLSHWATLQGLRTRSHLTHTESRECVGGIDRQCTRPGGGSGPS